MTSAERITTIEAARRLGCSVSTVARLARNGELPATRDRLGYLFDPGDVARLAERRLERYREAVEALEAS